MKKINKVLLLIIVINLLVTANLMYFPLGLRHIYHLLVAPEDLYDPIVIDNFPFDKKGFYKTYTLKPKYFDVYDLSILFPEEKISSKYKFNGKLIVEFLYKDEVVSKKIADRNITAGYAGNDMSKYKRITLLNFALPINKKYKDNISVKITVLEIDQQLEKYKDSIMLNIAVSPTP